jgi:hypothetical protein
MRRQWRDGAGGIALFWIESSEDRLQPAIILNGKV